MIRFILLTIMSFSTIFLLGQVVEKDMNLSVGERSGLEVDLPVNKKTAEKLWKEYVKSYGKVDWDRKNKEHVLFDVNVSSISSESLTIVARFNQHKDITKGSFWFKSGDDFISSSSDGDAIRGAGSFLQEYAYEAQRSSIREEIKEEDKQLSGLEKDMKKLQKKNQNLHKDIEKAKELIIKKEKEIEDNLKSQEEKKVEMEGQREKIQQTTVKLTNVGNS